MLTGRSTLNRDSWTDLAIKYAEEYRWKIVPVDTSTGPDPHSPDDPVVEQLGADILVDYPEEATTDPKQIEDLGTQIPSARVGALTGETSDLLAVEIEKNEDPSPLEARVDEIAGTTRRVVGPTREYLLFQYPKVDAPLPPLTERNGVVLHGDGSVIFLPNRAYKWGLDSKRHIEPAGKELLSLFGLGDRVIPSNETDVRPDAASSSEPAEPDSGESVQLNLPLKEPSSDGQPPVKESGDLFRSGTDLHPDLDEDSLDLPWTVPGGFTLLTGRPKTSGKSTWAINLAAHLAAGASFLGEESPPSTVVLLADTSPANFRRRLQRVGILDENARTRLHVLHPSDVRRRNWSSTLHVSFRHAASVGADLVIIDCLDRYITLKGDATPTESEQVVHVLTAEAPSDCAVLGVRSTDCSRQESISRTTQRLGLLGRSADEILRLDNISTPTYPTLRRLSMASRTTRPQSSLFCALRRGRYERIHRKEASNVSILKPVPVAPEENIDRLVSTHSEFEQLPE